MIEFKLSALKDAHAGDCVQRFIFGGLCTTLAGIIAKQYGPVIGGLFLAFPAIFPASASMIESHEKEKKAAIAADGTARGRGAAALDAAGAAIGCVGLAIFAVTVWLLLPGHDATAVISAATAAWIAASTAGWLIFRKRPRNAHARLNAEE